MRWPVAVALRLVGMPLGAPLLLVFGRTWAGRLCGATWLAFDVWVVVLFGEPGLGESASRLPFSAWILLFWVWFFALPRARPPGEYGPGSYWPDARPDWGQRWWQSAPSALETDLVRVAVGLVTRLDPWIRWAEARTTRRVMRRLLTEMDADPAYRSLWPGYRAAWQWFVTGRHWWGHVYSYIPRPRDGHERLGLVVFLHGHGPNSALYLHAWRRFCDEHRVGVVCPSFGYGNWEHPDAVEAVRWTVSQATAGGLIDTTRVYLAGISQGGCGVGRAGAAMPGAFAGLAFISPTMEPDVLESPEFVAGWKGRPVLVIQGGRDHNVRPATVDAAVERMRADGVAVTYHLDPEADHFLFFAKLDEMDRLIGGWVEAQTPPPNPLSAAGRGDRTGDPSPRPPPLRREGEEDPSRPPRSGPPSPPGGGD